MTSGAIRCPVRLSSCMFRTKLRKSVFRTSIAHWVALFGFLPRSVLLEANGKFCAAVGNFCATVVAFGVFTVLKSSTL